MIKYNFTLVFAVLITAISMQAKANVEGYITDDLTIFMHSGPGTNYRIIGTINAGAKLHTTGKTSSGYSEIVDEKKRIAWVETEHVTRQPGLRYVVDDINEQLTNYKNSSVEFDGEINQLKSDVSLANQENNKLQAELKTIQQQLAQTQSKLKDQDTSVKREWFFNGAVVLGLGLLLGLILPKFFARRRSSSMAKWG